MRISGAIFDLDGTLLHTLPIVIAAFRKALFSTTGRWFGNQEIMSLFGPTEAGILRRAVPERWPEALAIYTQEYKDLFVSQQIGPFPGLRDALQLLRRHHIPTAIVTGKSASSTAFSLEKAGLQDHFDLVLTGSADGPVKPDLIRKVLEVWSIRPAQGFYLGDSPSDLGDARQVGVIPLGAAWADGACFGELDSLRPEATFKTVGAFIQWIADRVDDPGST